MMNMGHFNIVSVDDGCQRFQLVGPSGQASMLGLVKNSLPEVLRAIADVRLNVCRPDRYERIEATDGSTLMLLHSTDGGPIGSIGPFGSNGDVSHALREIQRVAPLAEIRMPSAETAVI